MPGLNLIDSIKGINPSADSLDNMGGVMVDRMPVTRISAMNNLHTGFNFVVSLNEFTYGFKSVSNIQRHREVGHFQEGGVNDHQITVGRPNDNLYTLQLNRGYIIHSPEIVSTSARAAASMIPNETARRIALIAVNAASPQSTLENGPAQGFIQIYDRRRKLVAIFSFLSLGMTDWTLSDLDATSSEIIYESITIEHTGLTLLPATWLPSVTQPLNGWINGTDDGMDSMRKITEQNKKEFEERQKKIQELEKAKSKLDEERQTLLHEKTKLAQERKFETPEEQQKRIEKEFKERKEKAQKEEEARKKEEQEKREKANAESEETPKPENEQPESPTNAEEDKNDEK